MKSKNRVLLFRAQTDKIKAKEKQSYVNTIHITVKCLVRLCFGPWGHGRDMSAEVQSSLSKDIMGMCLAALDTSV